MITTKSRSASGAGAEHGPAVLVGLADRSARPSAVVAAEEVAVVRGVAGIVGELLVMVSVLNLGMLWWSPQFGTAPWEFAVVGQTFDQVPLLVMGLLLLTYPAVARGDASRMTLAALVGVLAVTSAALTVLFSLAATVAWSTLVQQPSAGGGLLLRSIAKTLVLGVAYTTSFAWWVVVLLRRPGGRRGQGKQGST